MRVQIISRDNGLGLSNDVQILRAALVGISAERMEVDFTDWQTPRKVAARHYDVNIFLELINPVFFSQATRNILVPNPEWFMPSWKMHLRSFDQVWAKTKDAVRIFKPMNSRTVYMGWTSIDRFMPDVPKRMDMIHVAGGSSAKGTREVLQAMAGLPHLSLTMITSRAWDPIPDNVTVLPRQDAGSLAVLMNEHRIHLCPSSYEGFGHYLNEARSCEALVITTNAAPMNELVSVQYGLGAAVASTSNQHYAQHKHVSVASLMDCIEAAANTPEELAGIFGTRARKAYLEGGLAFDEALIHHLS